MPLQTKAGKTKRGAEGPGRRAWKSTCGTSRPSPAPAFTLRCPCFPGMGSFSIVPLHATTHIKHWAAGDGLLAHCSLLPWRTVRIVGMGERAAASSDQPINGARCKWERTWRQAASILTLYTRTTSMVAIHSTCILGIITAVACCDSDIFTYSFSGGTAFAFWTTAGRKKAVLKLLWHFLTLFSRSRRYAFIYRLELRAARVLPCCKPCGNLCRTVASPLSPRSMASRAQITLERMGI